MKGMDDKSYSGGGARDKAMLVNFWASWCEPCKQEAPELDKLAAEYADKLEIYGVNVSKYDNAKKARQFVQDFNLQYPILLDTKGEVFEELYKGQVFPTNVLIDRNGVIQEIILGAPDPRIFVKGCQADKLIVCLAQLTKPKSAAAMSCTWWIRAFILT